MTTAEQTMIERVARAQERVRQSQWTDEQFETWWERDPFFTESVTSWGYFTGTRKGRCLFEARKAIEALREPNETMTGAMIDAGYDGSGMDAARDFTAAIDAILNEETGT